MSHGVKTLERGHHTSLPEFAWDEISEAGAYVERDTGNLYRIPSEAFTKGAPMVFKETSNGSRMVQISRNPFVTTEEARLTCAQHNIAPHF